MYEEITYETLLGRMLERAGSIDGNVDTREGSLVWLGSAPVAMELQNLYLALDNLFAETFADTASREYLIRRAGERGIVPYSATPAVLRLEVVPTSLSLSMNTRFSIGALNYAVTDDLGSGAYELTCETAGQEGNQYSGPVVPIDFIEGLESCSVTALLVPGEDEEDTEALRQRYFDSLNAQAFGGNRIDYIEKTKALPGVGGVKVYRAWNGDVAPASLAPPEEAAVWMQGLSGVPEMVKTWLEAVYAAGSAGKLTVGGTVKLVLIDSTFSQPSATLISQVQTAIDPEQNAGEGLGIAPIGHVVKVHGVGGVCRRKSRSAAHVEAHRLDFSRAHRAGATQQCYGVRQSKLATETLRFVQRLENGRIEHVSACGDKLRRRIVARLFHYFQKFFFSVFARL